MAKEGYFQGRYNHSTDVICPGSVHSTHTSQNETDSTLRRTSYRETHTVYSPLHVTGESPDLHTAHPFTPDAGLFFFLEQGFFSSWPQLFF